MEKTLENSQLKNETLKSRKGLNQFEKTAIHYFHEESEDRWLNWYDILSVSEKTQVQNLLGFDENFISRQRERNN